MRKKVTMLSALACLAGGPVLLAPASGQVGHPACEGLIGTSCTQGSSVVCTWEGRYLDGLYCHGGTWE